MSAPSPTLLNRLLELASHPGMPVEHDWVEQASRELPCCPLPGLLHLMRHGADQDPALLNRVALAMPDRAALARLVSHDAAALARLTPPAEPPVATPDTDTTIEQFLQNYGHSDQHEIDALTQAIFHPQPDYADVLAAQERHEQQGDTPGHSDDDDEQDRLINNFLAGTLQDAQQAAQVPAQPLVDSASRAEIAHAPIAEPTETDDSMLSESLAKMYIARHKYQQALEIIERINLKFPEKSIYFADQIRFLRKLVLIQNINNTK